LRSLVWKEAAHLRRNLEYLTRSQIEARAGS
jgi:hypothetical protein